MLLYVRFGRRILFRAYDGMEALAHTSVLPEATRVSDPHQPSPAGLVRSPDQTGPPHPAGQAGGQKAQDRTQRGGARGGVLEESLCRGRQAQGEKGRREALRASQKARMTAHEV